LEETSLANRKIVVTTGVVGTITITRPKHDHNPQGERGNCSPLATSASCSAIDIEFLVVKDSIRHDAAFRLRARAPLR
jgi:hypothetical protein